MPAKSSLTAETAAGFWALPGGAKRAEIVLGPLPGFRSEFAPATYRIRNALIAGEFAAPLGALRFTYVFGQGVPVGRVGKPFAGVGATFREVQPDGASSRPMLIGNVGDLGDVCWGAGDRKEASNPALAWANFWTSPFNDHLVPGDTLPGSVPTSRRAEFLAAEIAAWNSVLAALDSRPDFAPTGLSPVTLPPPASQSPLARWERFRKRYRANADVFQARGRGQRRRFVNVLDVARYGASTPETRLTNRLRDLEGSLWNYSECLRSGRYSYETNDRRHDILYYAERVREMTFSLPRYAAYIAAWVAHAKSYANLGAPDLPALRNASKALAATFTPSWQEFYAGHWRSTANGQPAPLASGDVLPIPGAATHAFMGVNSGLLRRHPEYAYPRLTEDSAPCPHANCPECNTARMIFVGFAFKVGEDFLTVILDPRGTRPPLRLVWKSGEFLPATKRFGVRDTPKQRRRDSRHVTRMRALRDPIISAALAAANVTLTRRKPVPTRT